MKKERLWQIPSIYFIQHPKGGNVCLSSFPQIKSIQNEIYSIGFKCKPKESNNFGLINKAPDIFEGERTKAFN